MIKFLKYSVIFGILAGAILFVAYNHNLYVWEEQPPGSMWIVNGRLFEGTNLLPIENPGILIKNGKIACLGNICEIPANAVQIDATGK